MKQLFLLAMLASTTFIYGQTTIDSSIKIVYANKDTATHTPAYFLNGRFVNISSFNTKIIDNINVINEAINIDGIEYSGQVYITTKKGYEPQLISLTDLKNKYTNLKNKPAVFTIDGNLINADYDKYLVDENDILRIDIDKFKNAKENIDLGLIKLLTKSDSNIKKSQEIRIRGKEVASNQ
ncbi:hypothetical protein [Parafilimonas sp.]|uniref:hypothetical protein n=1 Tax=Parafilimonas sp. TaxID=1969739 RepID=UPI003F80EDE7